jgi:hypothetical protein
VVLNLVFPGIDHEKKPGIVKKGYILFGTEEFGYAVDVEIDNQNPVYVVPLKSRPGAIAPPQAGKYQKAFALNRLHKPLSLPPGVHHGMEGMGRTGRIDPGRNDFASPGLKEFVAVKGGFRA